uniref:Cadherin N-terminal domain-containing protein n=1 Tax=Oryzias melastigma TaxID=30732 RepID=A0A3B3BCA0_ORYME
MEKGAGPRLKKRCWIWFSLPFLLVFGHHAVAELRYSVPEEIKDGTVVGNVAKDLGLDKSSLKDRRFRVVSESKDHYFDVNEDDGLRATRILDPFLFSNTN